MGLLGKRGEENLLELCGGLAALQILQEGRGGVLIRGAAQNGGGVDDLTAHVGGGGGGDGELGGVGVGGIDDAAVDGALADGGGDLLDVRAVGQLGRRRRSRRYYRT